MKLHKGCHSVYKTQYHLVWPTKYRRKILNAGVQAYLRTKLEETRKYYLDWEYVDIGMETDHIHLHMIIPPKYAVSDVVAITKRNTSKALRAKFAFLSQVYWDDKGIWSVGFFASTVGINEAIIKRYVAYQGKEDSGQTLFDW